MYQRARKLQDSNHESIDDSPTLNMNNNNINSNHHHYNYHHSNNSNHHHHHHHHHHNIPANKQGKRYTMNEVFQVWNDCKDHLLQHSNPSNKENYKLINPEPIYHLELQSNFPLEKQKREEKEVGMELPNESLSNLNISDTQTPTPTSVAATTSSSIPATTSGPPPGMNLDLNLDSKPLVGSDKIEWFYIDPSGNEQGPFNGDMMQDWLSGGYLNLDLQIRRKEESQFKTLKDLCDGLQNYIQPFKVPLPDLSIQTPSSSQFFPTNSTNNNINNNNDLSFPFPNTLNRLGSSTSTNLFTNEFIKQDPFANTTNPNFGLDTSFNQTGMDLSGFPSMPSLLQQQIHNQQQPNLSRASSSWGLDSFSKPQTPVGNGPSLASQISQPAPMSPWMNQSSSRVNSPFITASTLNKVDHVEDDSVLDEIHNSVVTDILNDEEKYESEQQQSEAEVPKETESSSEVQKVEPEESIEEIKPTTELKPVVPQKLAPWAAPNDSKPQLSLKEIQKLEAEKLAKQKKLDQLKKEQKSAIAWAEANSAAAAEPEKTVLPSSWGSATSTTAPLPTKVSLAEIQRLQKQEKAKELEKSKDKGNVESFASALSDGGWTKVSSRHQGVSSTATSTTPQHSQPPPPVKAVHIPQPRPQQAQSLASTASQTTNKSETMIRLVNWTSSQLTNLYPTIAKNNILDIIIQLNNKDLIAETIYASSATMDGRRFATEFLKKKQQVDKQIGNDHPSWSSIITSAANKTQTVDEDGWIQSKKKVNKRN